MEEALVYPNLFGLDRFQKIPIIVHQSTHHVVLFITRKTVNGQISINISEHEKKDKTLNSTMLQSDENIW